MGPKAVGTFRLRRKRNGAPTSLRETHRNTTTGSFGPNCGPEESKAQPSSGRSSLSGRRQWRGKGKGRGTQAYSMEEDEEDEPPNIPEQEDLDLGSLASPKSAKSEKKTGEDIADRSSLVHRVLEGLRGDAFLVARDTGLDALATKGGLDELVDRIGKMAFPRATEEARELFRAGQRVGGPLARQQGESMVSFCSRRRRWWRILCELRACVQN